MSEADPKQALKNAIGGWRKKWATLVHLLGLGEMPQVRSDLQRAFNDCGELLYDYLMNLRDCPGGA